MYTARRIIVVGVVQGVGFRPFIHRLAYRLGLKGYVRNIGGSEVEIWIEGGNEKIEEFLKKLYVEKPPPAIIEELYVEETTPRNYKEFRILRSSIRAVKRSNIPPDYAICKECLREILDPSNRRYRYAFNSCAWCGPRFSMMYKTPYDRENTAMAKYKLCDECLREYNDINNIRRYHAQGISCPQDGPRLKLYTMDFEEVETSDPIREAARLIDEGYIVAIKGVGGYHIAALATSDEVVVRLRERKKRPRKPFAIMGLDTDVLSRIVYVDEDAKRLLESPMAPILLLPKRENSPVSPLVSPGLPWEGVFIAYTGLHYLLLMETRDKFLIMTSGNVSGEPMCIDEECVRKKLSGIVDYVLNHDREIVNRVDDSVLRRTSGEWVFLRRSRGYAPLWLRIRRDLGGEYIAFGADLNNTASIGFEDKIVLTQYIGDLESIDAQNDLVKYIEYFTRNYHIDPSRAIIVVDKHPGYYSRRIGIDYAEKYGAEVVEVQHHYAHLIGTVYDHGLSGRILGLAIDGIGYGDDNTIWGGEVILLDSEQPVYERLASLEQLPLTSDRDTIYPARLLVGYLALEGYDWDEIYGILKQLKLLDKVPGKTIEYRAVYSLVHNNKYTPASSTGRLLDLVSTLLGVSYHRSYEGEPAIRLEAEALINHSEPVLCNHFKITTSNGLLRLSYRELIHVLINNSELIDPGSILYSLGYWFGELIVEASKGRRAEDKVVVSGGAAVNTYIIAGLRNRLSQDGFKVVLPRRIPANDEGVSFGQIVAASLKKSLG